MGLIHQSPGIVPYALGACLLLLLYVRSVMRWRARTRGRSLPPGPRRLPIIGNMLSMPAWKPWYGYRALSAKYGDITYLEALGSPVLVLGSPGVMRDFLEKRSANTGDRVETPLIALAGQAFNFAFMPYGQWWRRHRRMMWQHFNLAKMPIYRPVQRAVVRSFLVKLLERPEQLKHLLLYNVVAMGMKTTYDLDMEDENDIRIEMADTAFVGLRQVTVFAQVLLQCFPFVQHIPHWVPGAGFHRLLARARGPSEYMLEVPFTEAKMNAERGQSDCIVANLIAQTSGSADAGMSEEDEEIARGVAAAIVEGGADTTHSTLQALFLALSLNPEVQQKARAELEAVVGLERLPDFDDQDALVYVNAIVKEALRWHNVVPLGVLHRTIEDDELRGYFIPAGTVVVPNVWACMHDPEIYPEPDEFKPERFIRDDKLNPDVLDPTTIIFGFGRRICPGRHFAEATLFLTAACVLQVFDISPPLDEDGLPVRIDLEASHGLLSYPEDGRCTIKPRSPEAEALILRS